MHSVDYTDCAEEIALPLFTAHSSRKKVEPSLQSLRSKQLETRCRKQEYDYFDLTVSLAVSTLSFLKMYLATTAIFDLAKANCVVCHATLDWRKAIENSKCKSSYSLPFGAATCTAKERQPQMPVAKSWQAYIFPLMYSVILPKVSVFSARNPAPPCASQSETGRRRRNGHGKQPESARTNFCWTCREFCKLMQIINYLATYRIRSPLPLGDQR